LKVLIRGLMSYRFGAVITQTQISHLSYNSRSWTNGDGKRTKIEAKVTDARHALG